MSRNQTQHVWFWYKVFILLIYLDLHFTPGKFIFLLKVYSFIQDAKEFCCEKDNCNRLNYVETVQFAIYFNVKFRESF